jgi:tripartite-type tricarboxylate transporter receptor subunit TctC
MGELLQLMAGIKLEHIPYRGGADVARELAGGRLDAGIISFSSLKPAVERGTTLLASTAAERQASLRQIPVIAETYPGYDLVSWTGCFAPAGTPEAAQNRFVAAIHHALKDPAIQARLEATGADPVISSPAAYQAVIAKDREVARRIVAATGLSIS